MFMGFDYLQGKTRVVLVFSSHRPTANQSPQKRSRSSPLVLPGAGPSCCLTGKLGTEKTAGKAALPPSQFVMAKLFSVHATTWLLEGTAAAERRRWGTHQSHWHRGFPGSPWQS